MNAFTPVLQSKNGIGLRVATALDLDQCGAIVSEHWDSPEALLRFQEQFVEFMEHGRYAPVFFVAQEGDGRRDVVGFCAMRRSMLKDGLWEFIWCAVSKDHQGKGIGDMMVDYRLNVVRENAGISVLLVTQECKYFQRFGFMSDREHGDGWTTMTAQLKLIPDTKKRKR